MGLGYRWKVGLGKGLGKTDRSRFDQRLAVGLCLIGGLDWRVGFELFVDWGVG